MLARTGFFVIALGVCGLRAAEASPFDGQQSAIASGQPQDAAPPDGPLPAAAGGQEEHGGTGGTGPTFHLGGFMDVDYAKMDDPTAPKGFSLGQFVLHFSSALGSKVSFFGETSFTATSTTYDLQVERAILRWDYNDWFKISAGKYHTPISYWNTAFHHGLWLQTTISRPEMIQFGGKYQPTHFVGLLAEGELPLPGLGLGYNVGVGNGRSSVVSKAGDAGDVNGNRATLAKIYARPAALYGVELGAATYHDEITIDAGQFSESIYSAYAVLTRETPEILAEYSAVHHHDNHLGVEYDSHAFYVQAAYRFPAAPRWKPYYRYEKVATPISEPVFGDLEAAISTLGVRFELSDFAAAKLEYRNRQHGYLDAHANGVFFQTAFTF